MYSCLIVFGRVRYVSVWLVCILCILFGSLLHRIAAGERFGAVGEDHYWTSKPTNESGGDRSTKAWPPSPCIVATPVRWPNTWGGVGWRNTAKSGAGWALRRLRFDGSCLVLVPGAAAAAAAAAAAVTMTIYQ
ncbi:hypothetical protein PLESTB_000771800 [Pleodorina starrii]|uniref:Uncharacterized protein n=1 Tax=Pleodorina starrii TaxID=330485 RepID=A0A9W6BK33_9CHLO|nr:hypothetical protein PLESTB_000771800 [Pleodorina starrii]GLC65661.1 hypothetical protein PLESTF_000326400 [Pleodorina starrii]